MTERKLLARSSGQVNAKEIVSPFGNIHLRYHQVMAANRRTAIGVRAGEYRLFLPSVGIAHYKIEIVIGDDAAIRRPIHSPTFILPAADLCCLSGGIFLGRHHP